MQYIEDPNKISTAMFRGYSIAIIHLIEYAKDYPENYDYAKLIALKLVGSKKVFMKSKSMWSLEEKTENKGYQYTVAGKIAQAFIEAGQSKYAQEILDELQKVQKAGGLDKKTTEVLENAIKKLAEKLKS